MREIWAGRAIARGYGFLFENLAGIIAYAWVPALLYAGLRLWTVGLPPLRAPLIAHPALLAAHIGFVLATMLLIAAIAVPLTRGALGYSGVFVLAHLHIGERELKLFWAQLRSYALLIALAALGGLGVAGIGRAVAALAAAVPALARSPLPLAPVAELTVAILALASLAYVGLRLSILIYPVAALDEARPLSRTWELGRGQVIKLLALFLAIVLPVALINFAVDYALFGSALLEAIRALASGNPDHESLIMLLARAPGAVTLAASLSVVVLVALHAGASAEAYRALTEENYGLAPEGAVSSDPPAPVHPVGLVPEADAVIAESAGRYEASPAEMIPVYALAEPIAPQAYAEHAAAPAQPDVAVRDAYVPHPAHDTPDWSGEGAAPINWVAPAGARHAADPTAHDGAYEGLRVSQSLQRLTDPVAAPHQARPVAPDVLGDEPAPYGTVAEAASVSALSTAAYAYQGWAVPAEPLARRDEEIDLSAMPEKWSEQKSAKLLEPV